MDRCLRRSARLSRHALLTKLARQVLQSGGQFQPLNACLAFRCLAKRTEVEPPVRPRKRVKEAHPTANPAQEENNPEIAAQPFTDVTNKTKHASPASKSPKSSPSKSFETQLHQRGYMNVAGSQRPRTPPPPLSLFTLAICPSWCHSQQDAS